MHEVARTTSVMHMRGASALGRNHRDEDEGGVETASPTGGAHAFRDGNEVARAGAWCGATRRGTVESSRDEVVRSESG